MKKRFYCAILSSLNSQTTLEIIHPVINPNIDITVSGNTFIAYRLGPLIYISILFKANSEIADVGIPFITLPYRSSKRVDMIVEPYASKGANVGAAYISGYEIKLNGAGNEYLTSNAAYLISCVIPIVS